MTRERPDSGWSLIDRQDEAAAIIDALVDLDSDEEFARSEIAEAADVPLKTLYLVDTLDELAAIGLLDRVDEGSDESEARFTLDEGSEVLAAARAFDEAVTDRIRSVEAE